MARKQELEVEGRKVPVSNLDKVMYPADGVTKADVIDYYVRVSPYLLPHFKDRPVTLVRYPDGVGGEHFYEKNAPAFTPEWVQTVSVPRHAGGPEIRYVLINDVATLVWCANLASLELHPFLHRATHLDRPTSVVFDLDPGEGADILKCAQVAFVLRDLLEKHQLKSFPKVSGSRGLQIYVPLNSPVTYESTRPFARTVAEFLAREHPDQIVAEMAKVARARKVFIDWSQNSDFKTTVGVYSLRAKSAHPFVSMPVTWDALSRAMKKQDREGLYFQPKAALDHLKRVGDLFAPVLKLKQSVPAGLAAQLGATGSATARSPKPVQAYRVKRKL